MIRIVPSSTSQLRVCQSPCVGTSSTGPWSWRERAARRSLTVDGAIRWSRSSQAMAFRSTRASYWQYSAEGSFLGALAGGVLGYATHAATWIRARYGA